MFNWFPLRLRTDLSFLQSFIKPKEAAKKCSSLGYSACAITDIDSVSGCVDFYKSCKENGIKPILGCEFSNKYIVLSKNLNGWKKLMLAVSDKNTEVCYGSDHICISGYYGSELANLILSPEAYSAESFEHAKSFLRENWKQIACDYIRYHRKLFGDSFFVSIEKMDNNFHAANVLAECFVELNKEIVDQGVESIIIPSNDCRYIDRENSYCHKILLCSHQKTTFPEVQKKIQNHTSFKDRHFFLSDSYHIPSPDDIKRVYRNIDLSCYDYIYNACEDYNILSDPMLPNFECPGGISEIDHLKELCRVGWKTKLNTEQKKSEKYIKRIRDEELPIIEEANLAGYFLIVQDVVNYVRNRGWLPGPGRGSAAGCLISYLIGITEIDPIPFNLLFSRFYNASRKGSLPDIDIDVPSEYRDEVIAYIKSKYGEERVSQMVTYGRLQGRSAIKEVMRVENSVSFAEMNEITKYIPDEAKIADELEEMEDKSIIRWSLINNSKHLSKWCILHEDGTLTGDLAEIFATAMKIEGTYKSQGKHAAAVVIAPESLKNFCPMIEDKDGNKIAGFEMSDLDAVGILKLDVLGVDILSKVMKIAQDKNLNINDFSDMNVWEKILCEGDTQGVFQLESQLGKTWSKRLKPRNLEEGSALIAVIRPGCLQSYIDGKSLTWHYINRKNKVDPVTYLHPSLEPILKDTYGILVYQEQAMLIAREIAGFSEQEADSLRKAIVKKLPELMAKLKIQFLDGCKKVGKVNEQDAGQIFDWIEASQRYSFNKSHSVSYAVNSYWSAYCKYYNQEKFYEVYLNHSARKQDSQEEIRLLVTDAKLHNIEVAPASLSNFNLEFTKTDNSKIYFGVSHIKDVGETECRKLIDLIHGEIKDLTWMQILMGFAKVLNKRAFMALVYSGALQGANNKTFRNKMAYEYDIWRNLSDREVDYIKTVFDKNKDLLWHINALINGLNINSNRLQTVIGLKRILESPTQSLEDEIGWIADIEKKYLGVSLTFNKADSISLDISTASCKDVFNCAVRGEVRLAVQVNTVREHKTKKGENMAFLSIEDSSATIDSVVVFPEAYNQYRNVLYEGNTVIITGKPSSKNDGSLIVEKVLQV
jgi:DNA polymerase-3 subunit alpha